MHTPIAFTGLLYLAEASVTPDIPGGQMAQYGLLGLLLGWFMWRVEKRMDKQIESNHRIAKAIEFSTRGQMVTLTHLKSIDKYGLRDLASGLVEEIDASHSTEHENPDR